MKYIKIFERYEPIGKLYCIYAGDTSRKSSANYSPDKKNSFTVGQYYELSCQTEWSKYLAKKQIIGKHLRIKNNNGVYNTSIKICSNEEQIYTKWINNITKNISADINIYIIYLNNILFIKEQDVEKFDLQYIANKYNL